MHAMILNVEVNVLSVCCRPTPKWGDKVKNRQSYILVMVEYSLHNTEIYKVINNYKLRKCTNPFELKFISFTNHS